MRERQSKILHANMCKVYIYDDSGQQRVDTVVGGLQDLVITFESDNYYYDFIGGREARVGKPSIKGNFRQGILDFNLLRNMFYKTLTKNNDFITIDLNDYLTFHQDKIRLELLGVQGLDDNDETLVSKVILNGVIFNSLSYEIRAGSFVLGNGTFITDSVKFGTEQKQILDPFTLVSGTSQLL